MQQAENMNARFKIAEFVMTTTEYPVTVEVYALNPGDCFQGFGGSSAGLLVKKTASLIVRRSSVMGTEDTEFDINKRDVWDRIFKAASVAKYDGSQVAG